MNDRNKNRKKAAMTLIVTEGCNLRCDYCFEQKSLEQKTGYRNTSAFMNMEMAGEAIDLYWEMFNIGENGIKDSSVTFFGGEPLLNQQVVIESAKYIRELDKESGIETKIFVNTNGTLVTKRFAQDAKRYNIIAMVSLDGSEITHNEYRKDKFGKGSFRRVIKGLEILREEGVEILISTVSTPSSINDASNFLAIVHGFDIRGILAKQPLGDTINFVGGNVDEQYAQKAAESAMECFKKAKEIGIKEIQISAKEESFILREPVSRVPEVGCLMYGDQIVIWPDGQVSVCEIIKDLAIGNLQTPVVELIRKNNELAEKLKQRLPDFNEECRDCEFKEICSGGCAFTAHCMTGNLMKKDPLNCEYSKALWRLMKRGK